MHQELWCQKQININNRQFFTEIKPLFTVPKEIFAKDILSNELQLLNASDVQGHLRACYLTHHIWPCSGSCTVWLPHSEHEGAMVTVRAARRKCIWPRRYIVVNGIKALNGDSTCITRWCKEQSSGLGRERGQIISRDKNRGNSIHWSIFLEIKRVEFKLKATKLSLHS